MAATADALTPAARPLTPTSDSSYEAVDSLQTSPSAPSKDSLAPVMLAPEKIELDHKRGASLSICFHPAKPAAACVDPSTSPPSPGSPHPPFWNTLLVFLNGLLLPKSGWEEAIQALVATRNKTSSPYPALLCYDRYGQGDSDPDPRDSDASHQTGYGHDAVRVVKDLHQLLKQVSASKLNRHDISQMRFIFVCNSIGCPIARLYARAYSGTVAGLLFLDSMMANTDFVSMFPDPDAEGFDPATLPKGVTVEQLREGREKYRAMFHPTVPNKERLDRRYLAQQLPYAGAPELVGPDGIGPRLTVIGHDWNEFAEQGLQGPLKIPKALTNAYVNPAWQKYNEGLLKLTDEDRVHKNVIIAKCCGHFVQKDDPDFVAREIGRLLDRLSGDAEAARWRRWL